MSSLATLKIVEKQTLWCSLRVIQTRAGKQASSACAERTAPHGTRRNQGQLADTGTQGRAKGSETMAEMDADNTAREMTRQQCQSISKSGRQCRHTAAMQVRVHQDPEHPRTAACGWFWVSLCRACFFRSDYQWPRMTLRTDWRWVK